ncbi:elastin-like [Dorcoceras hygrometricum]|uniref:AT-hook motif nuclear-localized protein n=1 Tax=Dorcoceras hygrometricum TaxID=472368 RepID=A0A2Z6ZY75_9LAMI|nr:elastin-like [Dorcoceras hygrometricum]
MELEDKESTESGSLGRNSDSESPPSSGGAFVGHGGGAGGRGIPGVTSMQVDMGVEKTGGVLNTSTVAVGGGVAGGGGVTDGGVPGGGAVGGGGGGNGELTTSGKKKRGRPRKYDENGNLRPSYIKSPPAQTGFTLSTPPSYEYSSGTKRGRGKALGSGNWQILASLGELFAITAGGNFTPHVVTVYTGEDVAGKILTFAQRGPGGICVLSANGSVSNVTIRQPGSSGGLLTYEGRFEILTLTGSYTIFENGKMKSQTGGLSVSLASPDGRVIGGGVAGSLMAANPIQVVVGSFVPNVMKMRKSKHNSESRLTPPVQVTPPTVTPAIPISLAAPKIDTYPMPTTQLPMQIHGIADNPSSASADTPDWNGSGPSFDNQKLYPDINISVPFDEH